MNWLKKITLFLLLFISVRVAKAQQHHFEFTYYTQDNGLSTAVIIQITKDSTGFLWLVSENGLMRFDGYNFKLFRHNPLDSNSIPSNYVSNIWVDKRGNLFVKHTMGISHYNSSTQSFKKIIELDNNREASFINSDTNGTWILKNNELLLIHERTFKVEKFTLPPFITVDAYYLANFDNGKLLLSNGHQIIGFEPSKNKTKLIQINRPDTATFKSYGYILKLFQYDHKTWLLSRDGLYELNNEKNIFVRKFSLPMVKNNLSSCKFVYKSLVNCLLVGFSENNLVKINLQTGEENNINLEPTKKLNSPEMGAYSCSIGNKVWVGGGNNFYNVDLNKNSVSKYSVAVNTQQFSAKANVGCMFDDGDVIWVAAHGIGLAKVELLNNTFHSYHPFENNEPELNEWSNNIRSIADWDALHYIVGAISGVFLFNKITHQFENLPAPFGNNKTLNLKTFATNKIMVDADGNCWLSQRHTDGVFIFMKKNGKIIHVNPFTKNESNTVKSIFIDSKKKLWLGTSNNIIYRTALKNIFDNKTYHFEKLTLPSNKEEIKFNTIFSIIENKKGEILIASENGFFIFNYANNSFKRYFSNGSSKDGISETNTRCFFEASDGKIWIGTNGGGLNEFDEATQKFIHYTTEDGLPENYIYSILHDRSNNLWLGTNKGIGCFNLHTKRCTNFTLRDGIQNFEFNTNAALASNDSTFVLGGINGISIFNPAISNISKDIPPVVFTSFLVNEKQMPIQEKTVKLGYNEHNISFQFSALSYFQNNENQFAYLLEGVDKIWHFCGKQHRVDYSNLPSGNYVFRVKACNNYGVWNEAGTSVDFTIATPWWKTWWFTIVAAIFIGLLVLLFFRFRLQQTIQLQNIRNNIAKDLHDEIGSNLSSIALFNEVAKENAAKENNHSILPVLNKIEQYTNISQEAMSDIVWMINAKNDAFENIASRMRSMASEIFEAKNITLHVDIDEQLNHQKLNMAQRKNFYLLFKEAVNNTAKYADCKHVFLKIILQNNFIEMTISDDGKGFDIAKVKNGNGLLNMKKRADELKGKFSITSEIGKGTSKTLVFPIH